MSATTLMEARDLSVHFRQHRTVARAVDGVSFEWRRGEILGVVGESGCGKSTLARALLGLIPPTTGAVSTDGTPVQGKNALRELRRRVQMIFQDPYQTLNPRQRVATIVAEPLRVQDVRRRRPRGARPARAWRTWDWNRSTSSTATRTSSRAGSASAWRSPPRSCSSPTG